MHLRETKKKVLIGILDVLTSITVSNLPPTQHPSGKKKSK